MPYPLCVAHLTALALAPADFARASAQAGFSAIGIRAHQTAPGTTYFPLAPGSAALHNLKALIDDLGVGVHDVEFLPLDQDLDIPSLEPLFEVAQALGARAVNVSGDDDEKGRLIDRFGALCALAQPFGLRVDLEFMRWRPVATLQDARNVVEAANMTNGAILFDMLHFFRSGGQVSELDGFPTDLIGTIHLCDGPADISSNWDYIAEARSNRLEPGAGGFPLSDVLQRFELTNVDVGVELPHKEPDLSRRLALAFDSSQRLLGHATRTQRI